MKTRKKLLALLLVWSLTLSLCLGMSGAVSADSPLFVTEENEDGTLTVTGLTEEGARYENLTIPATIDGKRVTTVACGWNDYGSALINLTISPGIEKFDARAFEFCENLVSVSIPATLTYFPCSVFPASSFFSTITVAADNPVYCAKDGVLFTKDMSILIKCPQRKEGSYRVPDGVYRIGDYAFSDSALTRVQLPDGLIGIGEDAFAYSYDLSEINLPDSVTSIGDRAFFCCESLSLHSLPSQLNVINRDVFFNCGDLTGITIPAGVTEILDCAFSGCNISSEIAISEKVTYIGDGALAGCSGVNVAAANPNYCSVDGVLFTKDMTVLITYPQQKTGEHYTIPDGVTIISDYAFANTKLSGVTIPNGMELIGRAFFDCENLTSIYIPDSVTDIGINAFANCFSLDTASVPRCYINLSELFDDSAVVISRNCACKRFSDMPPVRNWAHYGIEFCITQGVMKGMDDSTFSPNSTLTRAQLVTILYRMAGSPKVTSAAAFSDVAAGKWFSDPIAWAAANGIVNGYPGNTFRPNNAITREQLATILYRYEGCDSSPYENTIDGWYIDSSMISSYARSAMGWAVWTSLIDGIPYYDENHECCIYYLVPQGTATRAQAATVISRLLR